jgi:uncharacterized protein YjbI with pentapeptide repeats
VRWREWLGVGERRWKKAPDEEVQPAKTLWDWLQLLIVPAILIGVTFAWSATQTRSDNKRADDARQDSTLQAYLDQMSKLMLTWHLVKSPPGSAAREVARVATLTALHRVDARRKVEILDFLNEAKLIQPSDGVVSLAGADLRGVSFAGRLLDSPGLAGADLRGARFDNATVSYVDFSSADLQGASFRNADYIRGSQFDDANLQDAVFDHATFAEATTSFDEACLRNTSFVGATFDWTVTLNDATGHGADFSHAKRGRNLTGQTMLTGVKLDDIQGGSPRLDFYAPTYPNICTT